MSEGEPILVFYDGWCSVCARSAELFVKYDKGRGIVRCVDFRREPDASELAGVPLDELSASLHARMPGGELLRGLEAIRATMDALGRGWQAGWTRLPIIRPIADWCYSRFARRRLRLFGTQSCQDGVCTAPEHAEKHN